MVGLGSNDDYPAVVATADGNYVPLHRDYSYARE